MSRTQSFSLSLLSACAAVGLAAGALSTTADAAGFSKDVVRLGVITDLSGPLSTPMGEGSVLAVRMAVEDLKAELGDIKVDVVAADHQNKADIGVTVTRKWFDVDGVDAIFDVGNSSVGLALQALARDNNKVAMFSAVAATDLTGKQCSPSGFSWLHDSYALVSGPVTNMTKEGLDSWYFIAADYAFGHSMVAESEKALAKAGGKALGKALHPIGSSDYSSFLLQAQTSGAKVVAFANAGQQLVNAMKQWKEFGMQGGPQKPLAQLLFITDVHGMGLDIGQGLQAPTAWYWNANEKAREFGKRFFARHKAMPTAAQASMYSAAAHYLKAVIATRTDDTDTVVAQMRKTPVNDFYQQNAHIREDGKLIHDFHLVTVKKPGEEKEPWDYYDVTGTIKADVAFQPLAESECALVDKSKLGG